jgi:hypothetical protein
MAQKSKGLTPSGVKGRLGRQGIRRSKTLVSRSLTADERDEANVILAEMQALRPHTRSQCIRGPRPCPWVSCKFHLYLDINPENGAIKLNFPDLEPWEMKETCALDIADRGGTTLEEVGEILNLTRERIRQVEMHGLEKLHLEFDDIDGE